MKIVDKSIRLESKNKSEDFLWIDVFPVDGMPSKRPEKYLKRVALAREKYNKIRRRRRGVRAKNWLYHIASLPFKMMNFDKAAKRVINLSRKYPYEESVYVCDLIWAKHKGNILEKRWLNETIELQFEDIKANAFGGYRYYLKNRYGDNYMDMPPVEKRETHNIRAYKMDK